MFISRNRIRNKNIYVSELVEASEEFVEETDEVLGRALGRQGREANDVREQDAEIYISQ